LIQLKDLRLSFNLATIDRFTSVRARPLDQTPVASITTSTLLVVLEPGVRCPSTSNAR